MIGVGISIHSVNRGRVRHRGNKATLLARITAAVGASNIGSFGVASDATVDGSQKILTLPALAGLTALPVGAGRATLATVSGFGAAVCSVETIKGYIISATGDTVGAAFAVAQHTGTLPFGNYRSLIANGTASGVLLGNISTSEFYNLAGVTFARDDTVTRSVDTSPHCYSFSIAPGPVAYAAGLIGGDTGAYTDRWWDGPIWAWLQLKIAVTTEQRTAINSAFRDYFYGLLP